MDRYYPRLLEKWNDFDESTRELFNRISTIYLPQAEPAPKLFPPSVISQSNSQNAKDREVTSENDLRTHERTNIENMVTRIVEAYTVYYRDLLREANSGERDRIKLARKYELFCWSLEAFLKKKAKQYLNPNGIRNGKPSKSWCPRRVGSRTARLTTNVFSCHALEALRTQEDAEEHHESLGIQIFLCISISSDRRLFVNEITRI